jgi:hypothetical protein
MGGRSTSHEQHQNCEEGDQEKTFAHYIFLLHLSLLYRAEGKKETKNGVERDEP